MGPEISYSKNTSALDGLDLSGFFYGWPQKPNETTLRTSIQCADYVVLAIDRKKNKLVGYITAITDHVLVAYIPFLEVEKHYQRRGIGRILLDTLLEEIGDLYMIDLACDKKLANFYKEAGFRSWHAMIKRNYDRLHV